MFFYCLLNTLENYFFGGRFVLYEISLRLKSGEHFVLRIINYSWLHMENPVLASPEHKLYGGVNFRKGRWSASTGIQYVKGLYTDLDAATKENFVLWDMQGSFKATNYLSFYVRGENLLAQRYEINAGYPMPKATFMGGVNINF